MYWPLWPPAVPLHILPQSLCSQLIRSNIALLPLWSFYTALVCRRFATDKTCIQRDDVESWAALQQFMCPRMGLRRTTVIMWMRIDAQVGSGASNDVGRMHVMRVVKCYARVV